MHDIKLGAGGIGELEFAVQYLQLKNCYLHPILIVQGTLDAVRRLGELGILSPLDAAMLRETYLFYRTIETILRLRNESVLKAGSDTARSAARLMALSEERLIEILDQKRKWVGAFMEKIGD
jgi:glutamate-ammonia-ligase adenylyltransferase